MGEERKVRGKLGLISYVGLEGHGLSIEHIRQWRERECEAGRKNSLEDFFETFGLCFDCKGRGVTEIGWSPPSEAETEGASELGLDELPLYEECETCEGTGKADRSKWRRGERR